MEGYKDIRNNLTKELDKISGLDKNEYHKYMFHYIMVNDHFIDIGRLPIRVPGATVGCIYINKNNLITKVVIDKDFYISYPKNVNKLVKKFVGEKLDFKEEKYE